MSDQQNKKPKKQHASKIEVEKRLRIVQEWIIEDWPTQDIVLNIINKWGLNDRHAKRYIAEARKRWIDEEQTLLDHRRKLRIQSLKKLKRSLKESFKGTPGGIRAILQVEKEINMLEGIRVTNTNVKVAGDKTSPVLPTAFIDFLKISSVNENRSGTSQV